MAPDYGRRPPPADGVNGKHWNYEADKELETLKELTKGKEDRIELLISDAKVPMLKGKLEELAHTMFVRYETGEKWKVDSSEHFAATLNVLISICKNKYSVLEAITPGLMLGSHLDVYRVATEWDIGKFQADAVKESFKLIVEKGQDESIAKKMLFAVACKPRLESFYKGLQDLYDKEKENGEKREEKKMVLKILARWTLWPNKAPNNKCTKEQLEDLKKSCLFSEDSLKQLREDCEIVEEDEMP